MKSNKVKISASNHTVSTELVNELHKAYEQAKKSLDKGEPCSVELVLPTPTKIMVDTPVRELNKPVTLNEVDTASWLSTNNRVALRVWSLQHDVNLEDLVQVSHEGNQVVITDVKSNESVTLTLSSEAMVKAKKASRTRRSEEELNKDSKKPMTKEELDTTIADMYISGKGISDIVAEVKKSTGYIYTVLNNRGVPKRTTKMTKGSVAYKIRNILEDPQTVSDILEDYLANVPLAVIYSRYNIHKNGLYYILDLNGVERRQQQHDRQ